MPIMRKKLNSGKKVRELERVEQRENQLIWDLKQYKKHSTKATKRSVMTRLASKKIPKELRREILSFL